MDAVASKAHEQVQAAFEQGDLEAAASALAAVADRIPRERTLALDCLLLLRASPGRAGLVDDIAGIMQHFANDPEVAIRACDALVRTAELLPVDVPPPEHGAANLAVAVAQRCLEGLSAEARRDPETLGYLQINLANALRLSHLYDRSLSAYTAALKTRGDNGSWWFNLGLLHKVRGSFEEGLSANERALQLLGPQKPLLWNIAICATALGQGARAAQAYQQLGIEAAVADSGMPYVEGLPPAQVRVAAVGPGHAGPSVVPDRSVTLELLWVSPLSPCHGVVQSASYREADIDYGDVVLWDAAPADVGQTGGRPVPRFPVLSVLRRGDEIRMRFVALERRPGAIEAVVERMPDGSRMFVHRERVVRGPQQPRAEDAAPADEGGLVYGKVVLAKDADLQAFRSQFEGLTKSVGDVELVLPELLERLGDTPAAGKAHTMWRGLERTVEKRRSSS